MPRATRAQGRPGTQVIPAQWQESHGVVAAKTMTICVNLRHPGTTMAYDNSVGHSVPTPETPYATNLPARVQAHRETAQNDEKTSAEESQRVTGYLVTLPLSADLTGLAAGDLIDFPPDCPDQALASHNLRIVEIVRGSLRFERDVFAVLNEPATEVTPT